MRIDAPVTRPMKVMVVEENASLRSMIRSVLELGDAEVTEADNAAQALALYGASIPDWVLIDVEMKGNSGIDLSRQIKRLHPDARVMLVTDLDSLALRRAARRAGAGGILVKENLFRDLKRSNFTLLENVRQDIKG